MKDTEKLEKIKNLRVAGNTYVTIAHILGCSKQYIEQVCKRNSIVAPKKERVILTYDEKKKKKLDLLFINKDMDACVFYGKDVKSYGRISYAGSSTYIHRVVYKLYVDPEFEIFTHAFIGKTTKVIMHTCDNPSCCNPNHLRVGTQRDNMLDRDTKKLNRVK